MLTGKRTEYAKALWLKATNWVLMSTGFWKETLKVEKKTARLLVFAMVLMLLVQRRELWMVVN